LGDIRVEVGERTGEVGDIRVEVVERTGEVGERTYMLLVLASASTSLLLLRSKKLARVRKFYSP